MANALRRPEVNGAAPARVVMQPTVPATPMQPAGVFRKMYKAMVATGKPQAVEIHKATALNEVVGQQGGYLVPTGWSELFFKTFAEQSILWPRAVEIPLSTMTTELPLVNATTVQSAGVSPFYGGTSFVWEPLSGLRTLPETQPTFQQLTLTGWNLLGKSQVSNQLLNDMTEEGELKLLTTLAEAATWQADFAFFQGQGSNSFQPLGMLNCPSKITVARAGSNHIAQADVAKMVGTLLPNGWRNAIWCICPTAVEDLVKITGYQGNNDPGLLAQGCMGWLFAKPVFVTEKLPALGTPGDILLCDPTMYAVGLRQNVVIEISNQEPGAFIRNRSIIRTWLRCDGKSILSNSITLQDAATVVSDIVVLAT